MNSMNTEVFHTQEIGALTEAMIRFHQVCPTIPKDRRGTFGKYAELSTVLEIVQPKLCECGLNVVQMPVGEYGLITILSHKSGEYIGSRYVMQPLEQTIDKTSKEKAITPQAIGAVITYQRRYAIAAILNLNIDNDTDADLPREPEQPKKSAKDILAEKSKATTADVKPESKPPVSESKSASSESTTKLINEGGGATSQSDSDPCDEQLANQIKSAVAQWEQTKPGVTADFKAKLLASGRKRIADFSTGEARNLLGSIQRKEIADFFDKQLKQSNPK